MSLIKTVFVFLVVGVSVILITPAGSLIFAMRCLGFKKITSLLTYHVTRTWARLLIRTINCTVRVRGRENIPQKGGVCFVSNHCGYFDIVLILAVTERQTGFIAKKELVFLPFVNLWILLIGGFFIDRSSPRKSLATIKSAVKRIQEGNSVVIFPEGHRSKGQGLLPFRPGSFKLATDAGAPVIPVAITGGYEVFEKTGRATAAPLWITFGKPIMTKDIPGGNRRQILSGHVREIIAAALGEQERERNLAETPGGQSD
jgi:1-acyl-sn-glycerol-3-phosphate acyltransferase